MYVPSDFFNANFSWTEAFPLTRPFQIGHHCSFHIMHKDVADPSSQPEAVIDPPDADHLFSAKVSGETIYSVFIFEQLLLLSIALLNQFEECDVLLTSVR